jgi:hypothetical protein
MKKNGAIFASAPSWGMDGFTYALYGYERALVFDITAE